MNQGILEAIETQPSLTDVEPHALNIELTVIYR